MPFWHLYYHIVWATNGRQPLIVPEIEPILYGTIKDKALAIGGKVFAINGIADHVHMAVSIPPNVSIASYIGKIKGASSYQIKRSNDNPFTVYWQKSYGIVSFRKDNLKQVVEYIDNQKEHHSCGRLLQSLEDCGDEGTSQINRIHEDQPYYDPFS
ncbi:MAG: IS200/IS605 family transposase [Armatimonadota bacterium]